MTRESLVFRNVSLEELPQVAKAVSELMTTTKVWLFMGELGAGKTTFAKILGAAMGVDDMMSSPSFSIVNEYHSVKEGKVYHFDFYRIKNEWEAMDVGVDEYFYSGYPCLVEWPEKIPGLIPEDHGEVTLQIESETTRTIVISVHDGKEENRI